MADSPRIESGKRNKNVAQYWLSAGELVPPAVKNSNRRIQVFMFTGHFQTTAVHMDTVSIIGQCKELQQHTHDTREVYIPCAPRKIFRAAWSSDLCGEDAVCPFGAKLNRCRPPTQSRPGSAVQRGFHQNAVFFRQKRPNVTRSFHTEYHPGVGKRETQNT